MRNLRISLHTGAVGLAIPRWVPSRLTATIAICCTAVFLAVAPSHAAAASPWWQVLTGSRPSNLWLPENQVQEVNASAEPFALGVNGTFIGGFNVPPFFPEATASNIQSALESAFGPGNVEVTGGPGGTAPFIVTWIGADAGRSVPSIEVLAGEGTVKTLQAGGSGRLVLTVTNLGEAPIDGSENPVVVTDELPDGIIVTGVEAVAGERDIDGPMDCLIEGPALLVCTFEGTLPPYEALEIEVFATLTENPPAVDGPGHVTVVGGGASSTEATQEIKVSPDKVKFGLERFSAEAEEEGGVPASQAGGHPFQLTTTLQFNSGAMKPAASRNKSEVEQPAQPRNVHFTLPAGLVGNARIVPPCDLDLFYKEKGIVTNECPDESAIGVAAATVIEKTNVGFIRLAVPVFNLPAGEGEPARFGFTAGGAPVVIDTAVAPDDHYRVVATVRNATQIAQLLSASVSLWGVPGDQRHDISRGWNCVFRYEVLGPCEPPAKHPEVAFLRQPVDCSVPLQFALAAEPWNVPVGSGVAASSFTGGLLTGCNQVPFRPTISSSPISKRAGSASGLEFELSMPNSGLLSSNAIAEGQPKKVEVALPDGMTVNPSQAEGLAACTPTDFVKETANSFSGQGCPEAAKIGSVEISTPLLEEEAHGSVYLASPFDNPFNSLLALYMVARIPERGILVKQAGKVELDPGTGQLVTTFDDLPQLPFDTFKLHFFGGDRAPLVMPSKCGSYDVLARFTPWSASDPNNPQQTEIVTKMSSFTVDQGPNGGPCPRGTPPFKPGFTAGTESNAAGSYSPLNVRLTREDGEQEFTAFSLKLPKGVIGKLAGIPFCSEQEIAAAKSRTGAHGGQEELEHPSCPYAAQIGRTLVGAGVGPSLSYVPGKVYLAGPYKGAKLSVVAITTAKVGPFDLGTVVIRQGLKVDPDTAEVSTDGSSADPIPHILQGIVVHARDIRVYVDRQDFILNPTSCERMSAAALVFGSGLDFGSSADDQSVDVSAPFQAADCASLGFKPKLTLSLSGGTKRGATPSLRAVLTARKGDANIGAAVVTLPHSEFLEQAHIRTVCTRVQFSAGGGNGEQCPKGSVYGRVKAATPLLDEPLRGPVYLRSSSHKLPDLVAALHSGKVDINLVGRIDSVRNGRIRNTFEAVPDAPVTKFTLEMQGGKKGLLVNSQNICRGKHRAIATFIGQNGKRHEFNPPVKAKCGGKKRKKR